MSKEEIAEEFLRFDWWIYFGQYACNPYYSGVKEGKDKVQNEWVKEHGQQTQ